MKWGKIMSEIANIAASVKTTLLEVARQAEGLGNGLYNAAPGSVPGTKAASPNKSVEYLLSGAKNLLDLAAKCDQIISTSYSHNKPSR